MVIGNQVKDDFDEGFPSQQSRVGSEPLLKVDLRVLYTDVARSIYSIPMGCSMRVAWAKTTGPGPLWNGPTRRDRPFVSRLAEIRYGTELDFPLVVPDTLGLSQISRPKR